MKTATSWVAGIIIGLAAAGIQGATITNDLRVFTGEVTPVSVNVSAADTPSWNGSQVIYGQQRDWPITNGFLYLPLQAGRYALRFTGTPRPVDVTMPPGDGWYSLSQVATNLELFTYTNDLGAISGRVLPGNGAVFATNNAGLPNETLTVGVNAANLPAPLQLLATNWDQSLTNASGQTIAQAITAATNGTVNAAGTAAALSSVMTAANLPGPLQLLATNWDQSLTNASGQTIAQAITAATNGTVNAAGTAAALSTAVTMANLPAPLQLLSTNWDQSLTNASGQTIAQAITAATNGTVNAAGTAAALSTAVTMANLPAPLQLLSTNWDQSLTNASGQTIAQAITAATNGTVNAAGTAAALSTAVTMANLPAPLQLLATNWDQSLTNASGQTIAQAITAATNGTVNAAGTAAALSTAVTMANLPAPLQLLATNWDQSLTNASGQTIAQAITAATNGTVNAAGTAAALSTAVTMANLPAPLQLLATNWDQSLTNASGQTIAQAITAATNGTVNAAGTLITGATINRANSSSLTNNFTIWQGANYAVQSSDYFVQMKGNLTATMPAPATPGNYGKWFTITTVSAGTNAILPAASETFNGNKGTGLAKLTNGAIGTITELYSDGTNWFYRMVP